MGGQKNGDREVHLFASTFFCPHIPRVVRVAGTLDEGFPHPVRGTNEGAVRGTNEGGTNEGGWRRP